MSTPLEQLCLLAGIASEYHDIWGHHHQLDDAGRLALLAAMHIVGDAEDVSRALAEHENQPWLRVLSAVHVLRADASSFDLDVTVPEAPDLAGCAWRLTLENGETRNGLMQPAALPRVAEREIAGQRYLRLRFSLPGGIPAGYHTLEFDTPESAEPAKTTLIVAPPSCYRPEALRGDGRLWGPAIQLYSLRSRRNWGIGDFTDLRHVVELAARAGAGIVGVNPLHALFPHNAEHASPYSPSNRQFLNSLYLDVEAVPEFARCDEARAVVAAERFQTRLHALRVAELVDYPAMAAAKFEILEILYRHFVKIHPARRTSRGRAFRNYLRQQGEPLRLHALYHALQEHFHAQDASLSGWQSWPADHRDPVAPAVARFAREHRERVEFYAWLQWHAEIQLQAAHRLAIRLGMAVGLYLDLAVSADRGGSEVWSGQEAYAAGAGVGAPPDDFALKGQDWGLPPFIPERLSAGAYAPFVEVLRNNMRQGGALRLDHVMGLMRLFWIPPGAEPADGAYVHYPFRDLLGILALESERNRCLIIGEDLGTVPDEVRSAMAEYGILSYRLLYFEREWDGAFRAPPHYPREALVAVSTHDLPTLQGWWRGRDLEWRDALELFPSPAMRENQIAARAQDRRRLLEALEREGLLPEAFRGSGNATPEMTMELRKAVHRFVARTPCRVMMVQIEDVLGQDEQANLPGTVSGHPNWRRKLSLNLEDWPTDARWIAVTGAGRHERGAEVPSGEATPEAPVPLAPVIPRAT
jgi:(1->4)-alpha-D-glucan 1-alpha-D-glucosylmutase